MSSKTMNEVKHTPEPWQVGYSDGESLPTEGWPDRDIEITTVSTRHVVQKGVRVNKLVNGVEFVRDPNAKGIDFGQMSQRVCELPGFGEDINFKERIANARRIVACVNAMQGISNPSDIKPTLEKVREALEVIAGDRNDIYAREALSALNSLLGDAK